ncbi:MAG: hypothetical protein H6P95_2526, partial [Candidatus Aminicenantes bacterium]|nr:hypothetical protein [Candidatus Aminicenantes bacterium]
EESQDQQNAESQRGFFHPDLLSETIF